MVWESFIVAVVKTCFVYEFKGYSYRAINNSKLTRNNQNRCSRINLMNLETEYSFGDAENTVLMALRMLEDRYREYA
jgi:hypothetical protein